MMSSVSSDDLSAVFRRKPAHTDHGCDQPSCQPSEPPGDVPIDLLAIFFRKYIVLIPAGERFDDCICLSRIPLCLEPAYQQGGLEQKEEKSDDQDNDTSDRVLGMCIHALGYQVAKDNKQEAQQKPAENTF